MALRLRFTFGERKKLVRYQKVSKYFDHDLSVTLIIVVWEISKIVVFLNPLTINVPII